MHTLRRLGLVALFLGFMQVVFGAIVRITGSGVRCGGFTRRPLPRPAEASRSLPASHAALAIAFLTLIFGALTANTPGAPVACGGFPWCRTMIAGTPLTIQLIHRVLAILLFGHL